MNYSSKKEIVEFITDDVMFEVEDGTATVESILKDYDLVRHNDSYDNIVEVPFTGKTLTELAKFVEDTPSGWLISGSVETWAVV